VEVTHGACAIFFPRLVSGFFSGFYLLMGILRLYKVAPALFILSLGTLFFLWKDMEHKAENIYALPPALTIDSSF
jgi:hypothetical protein